MALHFVHISLFSLVLKILVPKKFNMTHVLHILHMYMISKQQYQYQY